MESRAFIKTATSLMKKIEEFHNIGSAEEIRVLREAIQKEINQLFNGLQNPTLPTAYRLRDVSLRNGFSVDSKVQHRLSQYEYLTS